ncbi:hypothetical protein COV16_03565 [Candidatus Woesearchaeota archaeon CG10_big_fil_rev_8_21_14_0_10_34_8]|nr:MAG: hypothetical protein COV16_03565 [Candidatus Woesearchaeota archaeon CG10_big_fil_rev_8_21_14_0_10_34_8]
MLDTTINAGSAVPTFIESIIDQAEQGLKNKGYQTCSESEAHIKLDLSATEVKEKEGGIQIRVISLGGKKSDANNQKITVFAKKIDA